jgi:pimeloyl-ACP methyl ester carboxylesterase
MTGARTAALIPKSRLIVYPNAPHAIILTNQERFLADLLAFMEARFDSGPERQNFCRLIG